MKNKDIFINNMYNALIPIVLDGIDENLHESIKKIFMSKLKENYSQISIDDNNYNTLYPYFLELEQQTWSELGIGQKLSELVSDENLEKIIDISNLGYKYATNMLDNSQSIPKNISDNAINEMKELLKKVEKFNTDLAEWYISEGSMDYLYASLQSQNTSLRVGHLR